MSMSIASLAAEGLDIAHAFDPRAITVPGWELLAGAERRGILVANTRALWPVVRAAARPSAHPVDDHVERTIERAFPGARTYFSHRTYGEGFLPFQKLAVATGLGALSKGGLVIHPIYGPWLALRAVILVDGDPVSRAEIPKPCVCDGTCETALARALDGGDWRAWLAVRDACSLREYRYSDEQIRYHYTKM